MREAPENRTGIPKLEDDRVDPERSKGSRGPAASHTPPSIGPRRPGGKGEKIQQVLERVYDSRRLRQAWEQIRTNAGAAGIDGMTMQQFEGRQQELLSLIREKLEAGTYRFKPVRRRLIRKASWNEKTQHQPQIRKAL